MSADAAPTGFVTFTAGRARVVCRPHVADAFREALRQDTMHRYASKHPDARALTGRGVAFAFPLPGSVERAVVRHNHHGGLFEPITRDLFLAPTRAPYELKVSESLHEYGVPTPVMLGHVVYDAILGFKRADVVTREVEHSADLSVALMSSDSARRVRGLAAASDLVVKLGVVGAQHADLNVKNILIQESAPERLSALVLDVDRVVFDEPEIVFDLNLERFLRSARKWQSLHGARVTDAELAEFAASVQERRPPPVGPKTSW